MTSSQVNGPAPNPCQSCPYRRDVPAGIWDATEYDKLPRYDQDTAYQPVGLFQCHQHDQGDQRARVCAGWVGVHGDQLLALRLAVAMGRLDESVMDYQTPVPLFATGDEAASHGRSGLDQPSPDAVAMADKISARRGTIDR